MARFPWLAILLLLIAITAALANSATKVETRYEMEDFFSDHTAERRAYDRYRSSFGRDDSTALILLEFEHVTLDVDALRAIDRLTQRLVRRPGVASVTSPTNALIPRRDSHGVPHVEPAFTTELLADDHAAAARLKSVLEVYAKRPWRDAVLSADGTVGVVAVRLRPTHMSSSHRVNLTRGLEAESAMLSHEGFKVRLAGYPVHRVYFSEHIAAESNQLTPVVLLVVMLLLGLFFRSFMGVILPLFVAVLSVIWTLGFMSLLGIPANALAPALMILVLLVSVTDSVHFVATWRQHLADGVAPRDAPSTVLAALFRPCLLTSLTTAAVFAGLYLTGIPLIGQFGLGVAVGVIGAFVVCVFVAPLLMMLAARGQRVPGPTVTATATATATALERLDGFVARHPGKIVVGTMALSVVLGLGAAMVEVNSPLLADLADDHPVQETNRFIEERLGGLIPLELVIRPAPALASHTNGTAKGKPRDAFYEAPHLARTAELATRLRNLPGVLTVTSAADVLDSLAPMFPEIPADQAYSLTPAALLLAHDAMSEFVHLPSDTQRIRLRTANLDTVDALALFDQIRGAYSDVMGAAAPEDLITGQGYLGQRINLQLVDHFQGSFLVGIFLVFLMVLLAFGRVRLALVALPSNLFPLLAVAGVMGFAGVELRYTSALVLSVAFGLAIDDTIHMLAQVSAHRGTSDPVRQASRAAGGIVWTSVVLALGLAVLGTSSFVPNQVLGLLLGLTALAALHGDLIFLPAALRLLGRGSHGTGRLEGIVVPVPELYPSVRRRLFELFQLVQDRADESRFYADLDDKDGVIVLRLGGNGTIYGFSTFKVFEPPPRPGQQGRSPRILFSGDTAVDPQYWGQRELTRTFGRILLRLRCTSTGPLYWLLSSKGYKTYLLLAHYFPQSWPRYDNVMSDEVRDLRDQLGERAFGDAYDVQSGVARLEGTLDRVRDALTPLTEQEMADPDIRFFVESNPGHADGDEMVCLAQLRYRDPFIAYARVLGRSLGFRGGKKRQ